MTAQQGPARDSVRALASQHPSWAVKMSHRDGHEVVELIADGSPTVDMGFLAAGRSLDLAVSVTRVGTEITIKNVSPDATLGLWIDDIQANDNTTKLSLRTCQGSIRVRTCAHPMTLQTDDSACTVLVDSAASLIPVGGVPGCVIELHGGALFLAEPVPTVRINTSGSVQHADARAIPLTQVTQSPPTIETLELLGDCTLQLRALELVLGSVVGPADGIKPTLTIAGMTQGLMARAPGATSILPGGPQPKIVIKSVRDAKLRLSERASRVQGIASAKGASFVGPINVVFAASGVADTVIFDPGAGAKSDAVRLAAGKGAVLTNLTGTVTLSDVAHSTLSAGSGTFLIDGLGAPVQGTDGPCHGSVLTGISIPRGLTGRAMLAQLGDVYHFSPDVRTIPGRDQTWWARVTKSRAVDYSGSSNRSELVQDAELVRELARLSREKGAPGSVVTKIAWCSYRLRALKARGKVEGGALSAYRIIGYGERPMPAFITWAFLSFLLAGPVLAADKYGLDFSPDGFGNFALEAIRLALGPAAVVTRSGSLSSADVAELAARVLTSIPLVTGVLALRNYLKSDVA